MNEEFVATNEAEAHAMVERLGYKVEVEPEGELKDEELDNVSGGAYQVGDKMYINGALYIDSYGEMYAGKITGYYVLQRQITGRKCEFLLKTNVGWVERSSVF